MTDPFTRLVLRPTHYTLRLCILPLGLMLGALHAPAQARVKTASFPFTYPEAIRCAGFLRAEAEPKKLTPHNRALWRYALAAGELGRRQGLDPQDVERAISKSATVARSSPKATKQRQAGLCMGALSGRNAL